MKRLLFLFGLIALAVRGEDSHRSVVAAPVVSSSPGFGNGLGAVGMMFFRPDASDDVSPNSLVNLVGIYSDTDSYFTGLFVPMYLAEDRWRVTPGAVNGRVRSSLNVGLPRQARFDDQFLGGFFRALYRVAGPWYVGGAIMGIDHQYTAKNEAAAAYFDAYNVEDTRTGKLGLVVAYDTRDDQRYPSSGGQGELTLMYAPESWAEASAYETAQLTYAMYHSLGPRTLLAWQLYGKTVSDDAPYFERPTLGQRGDLRGYTPGEIIGDHSVSLQAELRAFFTGRLGGVVFGGAGAVWEEAITSDDLYPSYGVGIRIRIQEENKVNFRVDYAVGEDDQDGWYVSVMEAF